MGALSPLFCDYNFIATDKDPEKDMGRDGGWGKSDSQYINMNTLTHNISQCIKKREGKDVC